MTHTNCVYIRIFECLQNYQILAIVKLELIWGTLRVPLQYVYIFVEHVSPLSNCFAPLPCQGHDEYLGASVVSASVCLDGKTSAHPQLQWHPIRRLGENGGETLVAAILFLKVRQCVKQSYLVLSLSLSTTCSIY